MARSLRKPPWNHLPFKVKGVIDTCEDLSFGRFRTMAAVMRLCTEDALLTEVADLTHLEPSEIRQIEQKVIAHQRFRTAWEGRHPLDLPEDHPARLAWEKEYAPTRRERPAVQ